MMKTIDFELTFACRQGDIKNVKLLVEKGADIHADDEEPLIKAVQYYHLDIIKYLVEQGANIHARDELALWYSNIEKRFNMVEYILSLEPNIYWITHQRKEIREIYKKFKRL